jgi:hypothetical protein
MTTMKIAKASIGAGCNIDNGERYLFISASRYAGQLGAATYASFSIAHPSSATTASDSFSIA